MKLRQTERRKYRVDQRTQMSRRVFLKCLANYYFLDYSKQRGLSYVVLFCAKLCIFAEFLCNVYFLILTSVLDFTDHVPCEI